jgi:hypothetical protein
VGVYRGRSRSEEGGPLLCDRCDGVAKGGPGWLGERESEQREKKRAEKKNRERAQAVWLGVARVAVGRVRREQRAETVRKREQR